MTSAEPSLSSSRLVATLNGAHCDRPPFWFMRQAGRYLPEYRALRARVPDFLSFCLNPELCVEATLQPLRRFGMDAAILFSDILVVPYALGQGVAFREGEGPVLDPCRDATARQVLEDGEDRLLERLAPVFTTVRELRRCLPADTALIGFAGAPWTVATYMVEGKATRDFAEIKALAYARPDELQRLIDLLVRASIAYLDAQVAAGAEIIQLFDSWAGVLSEREFERWAVGPVKTIVTALKQRHPGLKVIGFPRAAGVLTRDYAVRTGVDAVGIDWTIPLDWAATVLQPQAVVQGNLDPRLVVVGGAPMREEALRILQQLGSGRLIFNLGHGLVPETNPAHVAELSELILGWAGA